MKNSRRTLPDQYINWTIPARTQTKSSQKIEKLKESKLNKIYSLLKLEAFKPKAKIFPFKNTYFKNKFKLNFCFWNWSSIISARPEKYSLALEDQWLIRKWPKNLKKEIKCKLSENGAKNCDINIFRSISLSLGVIQ